jgi:hypothetical protein
MIYKLNQTLFAIPIFLEFQISLGRTIIMLASHSRRKANFPMRSKVRRFDGIGIYTWAFVCGIFLCLGDPLGET